MLLASSGHSWHWMDANNTVYIGGWGSENKYEQVRIPHKHQRREGWRHSLWPDVNKFSRGPNRPSMAETPIGSWANDRTQKSLNPTPSRINRHYVILLIILLIIVLKLYLILFLSFLHAPPPSFSIKTFKNEGNSVKNWVPLKIDTRKSTKACNYIKLLFIQLLTL